LSLIAEVKKSNQTEKRIYYIFLLAFGIILNVLESFIPKPFPWFRIGLSKIALLLVVYSFNWKKILLFPFLRVTISFIITGLILTPIYLWSLIGSLISAIVMKIFITFFRNFFSMYGISIAGAMVNNFTQWFFIINIFNFHYGFILPYLLIQALVGGLITAYFALAIDKGYKRNIRKKLTKENKELK